MTITTRIAMLKKERDRHRELAALGGEHDPAWHLMWAERCDQHIILLEGCL